MMKITRSPNSQKYLRAVVKYAKQYGVFIFIVTFLAIYVYQVNRIGHLIQDEPSQAAIDSKLKPVSQLKIDEQSIKQITDLEAQNVEVKTLFDAARENPFLDCPAPKHINTAGECVN